MPQPIWRPAGSYSRLGSPRTVLSPPAAGHRVLLSRAARTGAALGPLPRRECVCPRRRANSSPRAQRPRSGAHRGTHIEPTSICVPKPHPSREVSTFRSTLSSSLSATDERQSLAYARGARPSRSRPLTVADPRAPPGGPTRRRGAALRPAPSVRQRCAEPTRGGRLASEVEAPVAADTRGAGCSPGASCFDRTRADLRDATWCLTSWVWV